MELSSFSIVRYNAVSIATDKRGYPHNISYFSTKTYVVGTHWKHLGEALLMSILFVLRFYGPVNPMGSCRAWSVYLTTCLLGRLSPLSG